MPMWKFVFSCMDVLLGTPVGGCFQTMFSVQPEVEDEEKILKKHFYFSLSKEFFRVLCFANTQCILVALFQVLLSISIFWQLLVALCNILLTVKTNL